jgi:sugar lactone lactonase YvrE
MIKDIESAGMAADSSGNFYVSDMRKHVIYKFVIATGVRTIFAGQLNTPGNSDNTGTNATFEVPGALLLFGTTLYVLDMGNNRVRQINTSTAVVSHYAGSQSKVAGSGNGSGTQITFQSLSKITADSSGNLFITQADNPGLVRRVTAAGVASTYAQGLVYPSGIAVEQSTGYVYVVQANFGSVRRYTAADSGTTTTSTVLVGGGSTVADGVGTNAGFGFIWSMVEVSGVLYTLHGDATIHKIVIATGVTSTVAGESGIYGNIDGLGIRARFGVNPRELAYRDGVLYVADCGSYGAGSENSAIRRIELVEPYTVSTFAGSGTQGFLDGASNVAQFQYLAGNLVCDTSGNLYVPDRNNHRIRKITSGGVVSTFAGNGTATSVDGVGTNATFNGPVSLAFDPTGSVLYVCEITGQRVRRIEIATATVTLLAGSGSSGTADGTGTNATFYLPQDISTDSYGNIYMADYFSSRIRKITERGVVTTISFAEGSGFTDGYSGRFSNPQGITVGPSGALYVADYGNNAIRCINGVTSSIGATGTVSTIVGATGFAAVSASNIYRDNTISTKAMTYTPNGIFMDKASNLYFTEKTPARIRVLKPDGVVTTIAGGAPGFTNGIGTVAQFRDPYGVTADSSGNLYVVDSSNYRIRKITMNSLTYSTSAPPISGLLSSQPYSPYTELITIPSSTPSDCNIANFTISKDSLPTVSSVDGNWNLTLYATGNASTPTSVSFKVFDGSTLVGTGNTISLNQSTLTPYTSSLYFAARTYTSNLILSLYTAATTSSAATLYLNSSNGSYLKTTIPNQSNTFTKDIRFVGINCNAPQTNLDVRGTVQIWSDFNQSNASNRLASTSGSYAYGVGVDTLILRTSGSSNSNSNSASILFAGGSNGYPFGRISGIDTYTSGVSGDIVFETPGTNGMLYERMRIRGSNGNIGIGTTTSSYPLHVQNYNSVSVNAGKYYNSILSSLADFSTGNYNVSIYAVQDVVGGTFKAYSDERIKENIQDVQDDDALQRLRLIQPKTYTYKDIVAKGNEPVYGFIAQQVRSVLPYSTSLIKDCIPDIYQLGDRVDDLVTLRNSTFSFNESSGNVRFIQKNGAEKTIPVEYISSNQLRIKNLSELDNNESEIFVYGREMEDFHTLNKDAIFTVNVAATQ